MFLGLMLVAVVVAGGFCERLPSGAWREQRRWFKAGGWTMAAMAFFLLDSVGKVSAYYSLVYCVCNVMAMEANDVSRNKRCFESMDYAIIHCTVSLCSKKGQRENNL